MPSLIRYLLLILFAGVLPLTVNAADPAPPPFQEGKDYVRLPTPVPPATADKVEVVEMFWYGCPHCQDLEPVAQEWLKTKPENVVFIRMPVAFGAGWEAGARAYYAAEALGVLDKLHPLLFEAFRKKRKLNTEDELAAFVAEHGVDQAAFRKAYTSFQTETQLRRGNQLAQRYGVKGVPALIVNGKYDVRSPRMFEVVDFLIAQETRPQGSM